MFTLDELAELEELAVLKTVAAAWAQNVMNPFPYGRAAEFRTARSRNDSNPSMDLRSR
jgi:hypothetical protein